jgi:hypothetical protein
MPLVHRLANTGTLQTTTYFDENSQFGAGSMYFNGSSYLSVASNALLSFPGDFTIEFWVYPTNNSPDGAILSFVLGSGNDGIFFRVPTAGSNDCYYVNGVQGPYALQNDILLNTSSHIAIVRLGTSVKLYVNGTNISSVNKTVSGTVNSALGALTIGYGVTFQIGHISNFRIVKGAALYTSNFLPRLLSIPNNIANTSLLLNNSFYPFVDYSSNSLTVTNTGPVQSNTRNLFSPNSPKFTANNIIGQLDEVSNLKGSILLNGTDQYLSAPANTAYAFGTGDFTVEAWIYPTSSATGGRITNRQPGSGLTGSWGFNFGSAGFSFSEVIAGEPAVTASGLPTMLNTWTHLAASRQGSTLRLFANGILVGSGTFTNDLSASSYPLGIGATYETYFPGYISNVRIVKGTALYTSTFNPKTLPTNVANTSLLLNTFTSQPFKDSSNNNFTITNVNSATSNAFTPPISLTQYPYVLSPPFRLANTGIITVNGQFDEFTSLNGNIVDSAISGIAIGTTAPNGGSTTDSYFGPTGYDLTMVTVNNWTAVGCLFTGGSNTNSYARSTGTKGISSTSTFTGGGSSSIPFNIIIDLGQTRTFNHARYYQTFSDGKTTHAALDVSSSGNLETRTSSNWTQVHAFVALDNSSTSDGVGVTFTKTTARYIRLRIYNDGSFSFGSYTELYNFKLF